MLIFDSIDTINIIKITKTLSRLVLNIRILFFIIFVYLYNAFQHDGIRQHVSLEIHVYLLEYRIIGYVFMYIYKFGIYMNINVVNDNSYDWKLCDLTTSAFFIRLMFD